MLDRTLPVSRSVVLEKRTATAEHWACREKECRWTRIICIEKGIMDTIIFHPIWGHRTQYEIGTLDVRFHNCGTHENAKDRAREAARWVAIRKGQVADGDGTELNGSVGHSGNVADKEADSVSGKRIHERIERRISARVRGFRKRVS